MPILSDTDLAALRSIQQTSLHDTVTIKKYTHGIQDNYGYKEDGFADIVGVACGFKPKSVGETMGNTEVSTMSAEIRLSIDTEISGLDQILLTHRYGQPIDPILFNISGTPIKGSTGIVIQVIKVTK